MILQTNSNRQVCKRKINSNDFDSLVGYLDGLSENTKKRFEPHPFDKRSVVNIYETPDQYIGYVAEDIATKNIVAYAIIKIGYLEHDSVRLRSYGLTLDNKTDCAFAPSVTDVWQGKGVGNDLLSFIISDLKAKGIKRIILWGGVQSDNERAVSYYKRNGFRLLGRFEHNGFNDDMIFEIPHE